jgi:hypothetical protein
MASYQTDREWSDRFLPTVKQIVGPRLLVPSTFEADITQATDLMILRARDLTIAARVRRAGYAQKYPYQFTLRSKRDSGAETELSKIVNGWADWMFYGHAVTNEGCWIHPWWIVDLAAWRAALIRDRKQIQKGQVPNGDGTYFTYFDLRSFPPNPPICVASAEPVPARTIAA